MLPFMESGRDFVETATVGSFYGANRANDFDTVFTEAVEDFKASWNQQSIGDLLKLDMLKNDVAMGNLKDRLMTPFVESVDAFTRNDAIAEAGGVGHVGTLAEQLGQLFDNKIQEYTESVTSAGNLLPIKTVDLPLMIKNQVKNCFKDIVNEEVSPSLIVKKQIEHHWIYSRKDPNKRWEYPQCIFSDDFKNLMEEGRGTKLSSDPVDLPLYGYDIVDELTDATIPAAERVQFDIQIEAVVVEDGTKITLPRPMTVNLADGMWVGGNINLKYTAADDSEATLTDIITGIMDWTTGTCTLNSASGAVKKVCFAGRLSNEKNENTLRHSYTREDIEWKIGEGVKQDAGYSLEQLQEHKALINMDLYQKTYNDLVSLITDMEDKDGFDWLDAEYAKYKGIEFDPLQWNPMVKETKFNCNSTIKTVALPSEYIAKELKFKIDRFLIDLADDVKMDDLKFVLYGNPRYVSLLQPEVKWIFRAGDRVGGIKLDYAYGVMTSGDTTIWVVSSKKVDAKKSHGLRIVPFASDKETITFKRYKFSTDVVTSKESAYKDPTVASGTQTYVWGASRYANVGLQEIQAQVILENDDFITI